MDVEINLVGLKENVSTVASSTVDKWAGPEPTMSRRRKWKNLELIYNMTWLENFFIFCGEKEREREREFRPFFWSTEEFRPFL